MTGSGEEMESLTLQFEIERETRTRCATPR